mmetsp:Transcript_954/g.860  ORF Transcript_954/g.860 Transcript_954/m.860 type:complete len:105 (+) Transcript_954:902-1216(+)|eukprot:CAMPEP_0114590178 /NCGR_PEP_ID=MMETSP0125-20121206/12473_1 /TAXON_ID=485358 ORGANISM="Aristerostoma sp., Strain ATCC 50986" /NCGR_SAMPLE_ID=MMETSP0125 /ASSEMBLY_ACC=CAM_ASM_000245 /LENGTH=104 /DNA_ID=CAMNT_0001787499 /DNA_START=322 /DNA_END=636 /DNA_ORIENTATION=-
MMGQAMFKSKDPANTQTVVPAGKDSPSPTTKRKKKKNKTALSNAEKSYQKMMDSKLQSAISSFHGIKSPDVVICFRAEGDFEKNENPAKVAQANFNMALLAAGF